MVLEPQSTFEEIASAIRAEENPEDLEQMLARLMSFPVDPLEEYSGDAGDAVIAWIAAR